MAENVILRKRNDIKGWISMYVQNEPGEDFAKVNGIGAAFEPGEFGEEYALLWCGNCFAILRNTLPKCTLRVYRTPNYEYDELPKRIGINEDPPDFMELLATHE